MIKLLVFILGFAAAWHSDLMAQSPFYGLFLPLVALVSFFTYIYRGPRVAAALPAALDPVPMAMEISGAEMGEAAK